MKREMMKRMIGMVCKQDKMLMACAALMICALFCFANPLVAKAYELSGDTSTSALASAGVGESDVLSVINDVTLTIDQDLRINDIGIRDGKTLTIRNDPNNTDKTLTLNREILNSSIGGSGILKIYGNISCSDIFQLKNLEIYEGNVILRKEMSTYFHASNIIVEGGSFTARLIRCGTLSVSGGTMSVKEIAANKINISGESAVITAETSSSGTAIQTIASSGFNEFNLGGSMAITYPAGAGVSSDGKFIATVAGGDAPASKVVIKPVFTVAFNGNGQTMTNPPADQRIETGLKATEPSPAPTVAGKTLEGWYKESGCQNKWNFSTDTVTEAKTLYAKWLGPTVTTTSLPGGNCGIQYSETLSATGTSGTTTWTIESGSLPAGLNLSTAGVISGTPTVAGTYNFDVKVADANGFEKKSLSIVVSSGSSGSHSITVENDGHGTGSADKQTETCDGIVKLTAIPNTDYEFDCWTSNDVDINNPTSANEAWFRMADSNVTVKANFKPASPTEKCTITFDKNGGSGTMNPQQINKGTATKLRKNTFTRNGYEFKNWNTKSDGSGTSYADEGNITANTDLTLYAQWKKGEPGPTPTPTPTVTPTPTTTPTPTPTTTPTPTPTGTPTPRPRPRPKDDDDDEEKTVEPSKPAVVNPDTVEGYFAVNGQLLSGVTMGKTVQGVAAQAVFNATRPAGFLQAFTFNMAVNGKVDYTLKNGVLTIIIPKEFQKAGRTFAIMALDKNGKAWTFADTDTNPATVTATINVEGYAFALIYKD